MPSHTRRRFSASRARAASKAASRAASKAASRAAAHASAAANRAKSGGSDLSRDNLQLILLRENK